MKKPRYARLALGTLFWALLLPAKAQKKVSELTVIYDYSVSSTGAGSKQGPNTANAVHTIYIKGNKSRSEITSPLFSSTTIYDANTGLAVILKEVSGQKLLIRLNADNWAEKNMMYDGIVYKNTTETRDIAGYKCIKAVGQTKSGTTITVFYARDLIPENRSYEAPFRTLDGLPLEYELTNGDVKIRYKFSRINFNPVPESKFDLPKSGFREMNYEESKKTNIGG
jgi:GLPGLI family protein